MVLTQPATKSTTKEKKLSWWNCAGNLGCALLVKNIVRSFHSWTKHLVKKKFLISLHPLLCLERSLAFELEKNLLQRDRAHIRGQSAWDKLFCERFCWTWTVPIHLADESHVSAKGSPVVYPPDVTDSPLWGPVTKYRLSGLSVEKIFKR